MTMTLETEQKTLLCESVEATKNVSRDQRQNFSASRIVGDKRMVVYHPGFSKGKIYTLRIDIDTLVRLGLFAYTNSGKTYGAFYITPKGFAYYNEMQQPIERTQESIRKYLGADSFRHKYTTAYQKWAQAEMHLWSNDTDNHTTNIGHLCREAIQEFCSALIKHYQPQEFDKNKAHDIARVKAVVNSPRDQLGEAKTKFLDSLVSYWVSVSNLVQRQEHGAQKEGNNLEWEDARRVVFQTLVVMFEIDRALPKD